MPSSFEIGPLKCQSEETFHGVTNHSLKFSNETHSVFYSGDGSITQPGINLIKGCDYAFIECQAMSLAQGAGHSDFSKIAKLSVMLPKVQMLLYHIEDTELSNMLLAAQQLVNVEIAEQGTTLNIE